MPFKSENLFRSGCKAVAFKIQVVNSLTVHLSRDNTAGVVSYTDLPEVMVHMHFRVGGNELVSSWYLGTRQI
jgi:hypothetical protein